MAKQTWTLIDTPSGVYVDPLTISAADVEGASGGFSVVKRRLCGGLSDGVDVVEVDAVEVDVDEVDADAVDADEVEVGESDDDPVMA